MDIALVNKIKRLALVALASDDEWSEALVLKGGNAIDLAYHDRGGAMSRTSFDLDFSLADGDFRQELPVIGERLERVLRQTYAENGYVLLDFSFAARPSVPTATASFWGGYLAQFKVIPQELYDRLPPDPVAHRRAAITLQPNNSPKFDIEFSKFEYIGEGSRQPIDVDGYAVYVYTPQMLVFEKVRAICQQLPQYADIIPSHSPRARARDFYDIHLLMEWFGVSSGPAESRVLLERIFAAKRVPLAYLREIRHHADIHRADWENVRATVSQTETLRDFDFYFEYVVRAFEDVTAP